LYKNQVYIIWNKSKVPKIQPIGVKKSTPSSARVPACAEPQEQKTLTTLQVGQKGLCKK
jgi:hypothetical protein